MTLSAQLSTSTMIAITNLSDKPIRYIVAFSGGKDSVAMVLHLLKTGVDKSQIELHHHEVDGSREKLFDWSCTTSYCRAFAEAMGLPIYFSYRKGGILREMFRQNETVQDVYFQQEPGSPFTCIPAKKEDRFLNTRMKFPAISADLRTRWCSSSVKISILNQVITHTPRYYDTLNIVCTGERRAESIARSKYSKLEYHTTNSKKREVYHLRPIIDFSDSEVWDLMRFYKIQPHPSYMLGWGRCSCQLCIFGSPNVWATLYAIDKEKVLGIAQIEEEIGHTLHHKVVKGKTQLVPIMEIMEMGKPFDIITEASETTLYWLDQALNTFTSQIFIQEWALPQGANSKEKSGSL